MHFYSTDSEVKHIKVSAKVDGKEIQFLVDTGASVSIIPEKMYKEKFPWISLHCSKVKLKGYTGNQIPVLGVLNVEVECVGKCVKDLPLIETKGGNIALLGRNWMQEMKLNWTSIFMVKPEVHTFKTKTKRISDLLERFKSTIFSGKDKS